jgi:hypothetical protein
MPENSKTRPTRPTFKPSASEPRSPSAKRPKPAAPRKQRLAPADAPKERESIVQMLRGRNSKRYFFIFLGTAIAIQIAHDAEHVVQALQVFVLGTPRPAAGGLLGTFFDFPIVHFTYNFVYFGALLFAVAWAYGLGGFQKLDRIGMWLLIITAGVQTYHAAEHVIQITQEAATGTQRPPGFIGLFQDNIIVHLLLNTIVWVLPAIAMWRFGGFKVYSEWVVSKIRRTPSTA